MDRRTLLLSFVMMMVAAWSQPQPQPQPPALPPASLNVLREAGWQAAPPAEGEWSAWTLGEARLAWRSWEPSMDGARWRLNQEEARYLQSEGQACLGLARGWALATVGIDDPEEVLTALATTLSDNGTVWKTAGQSVLGRPIEVVRLGSGPNRTLVFGVFHGDEPAGEVACRRLVEYLVKTPSELAGRSVVICPVLNPDGLAAQTRVNANSVDVNRNFPAKNWTSEGEGTRYWGGPGAASEPETQVVMQLLSRFVPDKIVSIHAPLHNVNYDGPAADLAQRMSRLNGYKVEPDIGYPTPGSFGTFAGREGGIPVITLEFPEGDGLAMWLENKQALLEAIRYEQKD
jgi:protein MpaA